MYRIVYVKDVEFGALSHHFPASSEEDAREKALGEILKLRSQYGNDIIICRLEEFRKVSDIEEYAKKISF
ncbi:MAG: hypothetical protein Greene041614_324 [Parcubacteria group bacterium Greene0416_14]|nr:MAG: hypothetical protein Greene041614_324 [Parcubacteria group bacterium Greene0416_14]